MSNLLQQAAPAFSYAIQLGDNEYTLVFRWNTRFTYWSLSIYDAGGNALYEGRRVLLGQPVFADIVLDGLPLQDLFPYDSTGLVQRIARGDLGNAVNLYAI